MTAAPSAVLQELDPDRAYGALIGQAVGDALGAPTEGNTRDEIATRYGWVDDFVANDPVGTDDTEFSVLTAQIILRHGAALTVADMTREWVETVVQQQGGFYGAGFSEMTAINNLRAGLAAPRSGRDNHEMWSDGSAMRIAPVGVFCAGDPIEAARLAGIEAQVSHARDGIYCAQAIAAAVAVAVTSDSWEDVVEAGLAATPSDSWSRRMIARAVGIGHRHDDVREAVDDLYAAIPIFHYPWADVAPEATALAFGVFTAGRGDYVSSVLGGVNVGRDSDTIAAMAGGMAGGLAGGAAVPERWRSQINTIRGHCIRATAGTDLRVLANELVAARARNAGVPA
jgi:ADP-ribosylglycohydrolase